ncbi:MAG TPA: SAM-dependent methyltransferase, partial [Ilumatobacteraceae bacterium]|nr:SAM-dependent methyltransferase [Ilumatobacteraceae bacterium]
VSEQQRRQHPAGVRSLAAWPPDPPPTGVVIANELLDNLPFRLAVFDGGWREVVVSAGRDSDFVENTVAPDPAWDWLPSSAAHGARVPIHDRAADWVRTAQRMIRQGTVMAVDYFTPTTAELSARPWRDWLRTYSAHGRGGHYLRDPGMHDITTQVCIDQLPSPQVVGLQRDVLRQWGIDEMVEEGQRAWAAAAARPDVAAMTMRSRTREAEALLEPDGLGGFSAASWLVEESRRH